MSPAHPATLSWLSALLHHPERSIDDLARIAASTLVTRGTNSTPIDRRVVDVLGKRLSNARAREFPGDQATVGRNPTRPSNVRPCNPNRVDRRWQAGGVSSAVLLSGQELVIVELAQQRRSAGIP